MTYFIHKKLILDTIEVLNYFNKGLSDVEAGSNESQPMHKELISVLKRLNKTKEMYDYLNKPRK